MVRFGYGMKRHVVVRNGYGAKYIWHEMVSGYGTKLQFCGTKWQWYEMVMVRNDLLRLQSVKFFFIRQYVQPCLSKNPKYTFYTIKSSLTLAY